jgi:hypothetical protein
MKVLARVLYTLRVEGDDGRPGENEKMSFSSFWLLTPKWVGHITRPSLRTAAPQDANDDASH